MILKETKYLKFQYYFFYTSTFRPKDGLKNSLFFSIFLILISFFSFASTNDHLIVKIYRPLDSKLGKHQKVYIQINKVQFEEVLYGGKIELVCNHVGTLELGLNVLDKSSNVLAPITMEIEKGVEHYLIIKENEYGEWEFLKVDKYTGSSEYYNSSLFKEMEPKRYSINLPEIEVPKYELDKKVKSKETIAQRSIDPNAKVSIPIEESIPDPKIHRGTDLALIIATNQYKEYNPLINPVYDATTIGTELKEHYGFIAELVTNPTQQEIYSNLKSYARKTYHDEDQLFIFIAGHGDYDEVFKEGYLVASNSLKNDDSKTTYISHSNLRTIINNIPCKHIFLVIDACFGGTFDPVMASRGTEVEYHEVENSLFIKRKLQYKTRLYLTSGGKEYVPDGRPGKHSPFARNLIEALSSGGGTDGILTFKEVLTYVEKANPEPRFGDFGDNEPSSDFLFVFKNP